MRVPRAKLVFSTEQSIDDMPSVKSIADAIELISEIYDRDTIQLRESAYILVLNRANRVMGWDKIGEGGAHAAYFDTRIIAQVALLANASAVILTHNHPSGNLRPSDSDQFMTQKVHEALKLLDITLHDHIIVSPQGWYFSFADEGLL